MLKRNAEMEDEVRGYRVSDVAVGVDSHQIGCRGGHNWAAQGVVRGRPLLYGGAWMILDFTDWKREERRGRV